MISIKAEKKVLKILEDYIGNKLIDPIKALEDFQDDEFSFYLKFNRYDYLDSNKVYLNSPSAQFIVNFQDAIYRIAALSLNGKADIRTLKKEDKEKLEIPFEINKGSTIEKATELLKIIKELLTMIPEEHRAPTLIALVLVVFGYLSWDGYLNLQKQELDNSILELAIEKLSEQNTALINIVEESEKKALNILSDIDEKIEVQGKEYVKEELKEVKKQKFPKKVDKQISRIKGIYNIIHINLKNNYLVVEEISEQEPIKIFYESDTLLAQMQDIKNNLHKAIDDEGKNFYIEAAVVNKNNKVDTRVLSKIEEQK